jgi:hypothetical protein
MYILATLNDRSTVRSIYAVRSALAVVSAASDAKCAMKISQMQIRLLLLSLASG